MGSSGRRKVKFSKIALVVCMTALIWVWADLALDETPPARLADIVVDESMSERLWCRRQCHHPQLPSPHPRNRKTKDGRSRCVYTKAADHPQRRPQRWEDLDAPSACLMTNTTASGFLVPAAMTCGTGPRPLRPGQGLHGRRSRFSPRLERERSRPKALDGSDGCHIL